MPSPVQDTLDLAVASLNVVKGLLAVAQKQIPPGPPDYPQLQTIITLSGTVQQTATQMAAGSPTSGTTTGTT
jgi:hypothetical protein